MMNYLSLSLPFPPFALTLVEELNEKAQQGQLQLSENWSGLWDAVFFPDGAAASPYYSLVAGAQFIAAVMCVFWLFRLMVMLNQGYRQPIAALILPVFVAVMLSNNGSTITGLSVGIKELMEFGTVSVLQQQVNGVKVAEAIQDPLMMGFLKDALQQGLESCQEKSTVERGVDAEGNEVTTYPRRDCLEALAEEAEAAQGYTSLTLCGGVCEGSIRLLQQVAVGIWDALGDEVGRAEGVGDIDDVAVGTLLQVTGGFAGESTIKSLFHGLQWMFLMGTYGGMFLSAMSAPIVFALTLWRQDLILDWLYIFLSFGLAILYYDVIVGIAAFAVTQADAYTFSNLQFSMLLGLGAPAMAGGLATAGAIAAIKGANSLFSTAASLAASAVNTTLRVLNVLIPG